MKQTAFRLSAADLSVLDAIMKKYNLVTRTAALRFMINRSFYLAMNTDDKKKRRRK